MYKTRSSGLSLHFQFAEEFIAFNILMFHEVCGQQNKFGIVLRESLNSNSSEFCVPAKEELNGSQSFLFQIVTRKYSASIRKCNSREENFRSNRRLFCDTFHLINLIVSKWHIGYFDLTSNWETIINKLNLQDFLPSIEMIWRESKRNGCEKFRNSLSFQFESLRLMRVFRWRP